MAKSYENVESLLGTGELPKLIPGVEEAVPSMDVVKKDSPYTAKDYIFAPYELGVTALGDITGMIGGPLYGLARQYIKDPASYGTREGAMGADRFAGEAMEKLAYEPKSRLASDIYTGVGEFLEEQKLDAPLPMLFTQPTLGIGSLRYAKDKTGEAVYDAAEDLAQKYAQSPYSGIQYILPPNERIDFAPDDFMAETNLKQIKEKKNLNYLKEEEAKKVNETQLQKNELEKQIEITKGDASLSNQEKANRLAIIDRRLKELPKRDPEKVDVLTSSFQNFTSKVGKYSVKGKRKDPFFVSFMDASDSPNAKKSRDLMYSLLHDFINQSVGNTSTGFSPELRPIKGTTSFGYQGTDFERANVILNARDEQGVYSDTGIKLKIKETQKLANENFEVIRSQKEHDQGNTKGIYLVPTQDFSRPELRNLPEGLGSSAFILYEDGQSLGALLFELGQPFRGSNMAMLDQRKKLFKKANQYLSLGHLSDDSPFSPNEIIASGNIDVEAKRKKRDRGTITPIGDIDEDSIRNFFMELLYENALLDGKAGAQAVLGFERDLDRLSSKKLISTLSSMANERLLSGPDETSPIPITSSVFQREILIPSDFVPTASNTQRLIQKYADSTFQGPANVQVRSEFITRANQMIPLLANHMLFTYNTPESLRLGELRNFDMTDQLRKKVRKDFESFNFQQQGALKKLPEVLQNKVIVDAISYSLGKQIQKQGVYDFDTIGLESFTTPLSGFSRLDSLEELQNFLATKGQYSSMGVIYPEIRPSVQEQAGIAKKDMKQRPDVPSGAFSPYYAPSDVVYKARDIEEANRSVVRRPTPKEVLDNVKSTIMTGIEEGIESARARKEEPQQPVVPTMKIVKDLVVQELQDAFVKKERPQLPKKRGIRAATRGNKYNELKLQNLLLGLEVIDPTIRTYAARGFDPRRTGTANFSNVPGVREYPLFSQTTGGIPVEMREGDFLYGVSADIIKRKVDNLRSPFTMDQFFSPNFKEAVPNYVMNTDRSATIFSKLLDALENTPVEKLKDKKGEPLPFTELVELTKGKDFVRPQTVVNKINKVKSKELPLTAYDPSADQKRTQYLINNFSPQELMVDTELFLKTNNDPLSLEGWYQNTSPGGLKVRGTLLGQCIGQGRYDTCVPSEREFNKFKDTKKIFNWFDENGIPRITYYIEQDGVQPTGGRKDVIVYAEGTGQNHPRGGGDHKIEIYDVDPTSVAKGGKRTSKVYLEKIQELRNYINDSIENVELITSPDLDKAMKDQKIGGNKDG